MMCKVCAFHVFAMSLNDCLNCRTVDLFLLCNIVILSFLLRSTLHSAENSFPLCKYSFKKSH